jgi:hypothetical protein
MNKAKKRNCCRGFQATANQVGSDGIEEKSGSKFGPTISLCCHDNHLYKRKNQRRKCLFVVRWTSTAQGHSIGEDVTATHKGPRSRCKSRMPNSDDWALCCYQSRIESRDESSDESEDESNNAYARVAPKIPAKRGVPASLSVS